MQLASSLPSLLLPFLPSFDAPICRWNLRPLKTAAAAATTDLRWGKLTSESLRIGEAVNCLPKGNIVVKFGKKDSKNFCPQFNSFEASYIDADRIKKRVILLEWRIFISLFFFFSSVKILSSSNRPTDRRLKVGKHRMVIKAPLKFSSKKDTYFLSRISWFRWTLFRRGRIRWRTERERKAETQRQSPEDGTTAGYEHIFRLPDKESSWPRSSYIHKKNGQTRRVVIMQQGEFMRCPLLRFE